MYKYFKYNNERFCVSADSIDRFHDIYPAATQTTRKEAVKAIRTERANRKSASKYPTPCHVQPFPGAWYEPCYGYLHTASDGVVVYPV